MILCNRECYEIFYSLWEGEGMRGWVCKLIGEGLGAAVGFSYEVFLDRYERRAEHFEK